MDDEPSGNFTPVHMDPKRLILLAFESEVAASLSLLGMTATSCYYLDCHCDPGLDPGEAISPYGLNAGLILQTEPVRSCEQKGFRIFEGVRYCEHSVLCPCLDLRSQGLFDLFHLFV